VAAESVPTSATGTRPRLRPRAVLRTLTFGTVATCFRYRVTGLAAEAGFFALLSLPPLVLGVVGSLGYFVGVFGADTVDRVREAIVDFAGTVLSAESVVTVVVPTVEDVLQGGRIDVISLGFLLSLWSGSRALNVYVDTITIMYGLGGHRGIIRTRVLSFSLYLVGLVLAIVVVPLILAGPELVDRVIPPGLDFLNRLYWPVVVVLSVAFLTTLYHVSVPVRTRWWRDIPGAGLALLIWILGSFLLREGLQASVGGPSIYGPLAAPIALLLWLYVTAIAVLIGAALNAEIDKLWPAKEIERARRRPGAHEAENPMTPQRPEA